MTPSELPWYARTAYGLLLAALTLAFLFVGRDVLIPLAYAALLSVLLHPLSDGLQRRRVPRLLAILMAVGTACVAVLGVSALIGMQMSQFVEEFPKVKAQGTQYVTWLQSVIRDNFGITYRDQLRWFQEWWSQTWQRGGEALGQTLLTFMDITSLILLVPLYAFLMLYYKEHIREFLYQVTGKDARPTLHEILEAIQSVVKGYVQGLMIEAVIVATLNSIALLALGIDYAILFGIIAALLNLIPYIGILVGSLLPILMALISKDSAWYPIGVAMSFAFIQLLDNNIIVPYVVASRVSINALISVIAVIVGGMLWGISGMFLSLPAVAILKIICDRVETLKPWGLILGQEVAVPPRVKPM
jgi:predicted PurR-regulated permease PerM